MSRAIFGIILPAAAMKREAEGRLGQMTDDQRRWLILLIAAIVGAGIGVLLMSWLG